MGAVCVQYHGVLLPCCQSGGWECRLRIPKSSSQSIPAFPQPRDVDKGRGVQVLWDINKGSSVLWDV